LLETSALHFRDVYAMNPNDAVAARHVEIVNRRLHRARQAMREDQRRRERVARELRELADSVNRDGDDQSRSAWRDFDFQVEMLRNEIDRLGKGAVSPEHKKHLAAASRRLEKVSAHRRSAEQAIEDGRPDEARVHNRHAAEQLRAAADALSGSQSLAERSAEASPGASAGVPPQRGQASDRASNRAPSGADDPTAASSDAAAGIEDASDAHRLFSDLLEKDRRHRPPTAITDQTSSATQTFKDW